MRVLKPGEGPNSSGGCASGENLEADQRVVQRSEVHEMRGKTRQRDGVYQRPDRPGFWISFSDARGQRRRRKVGGAYTLQQARAALAAELQKVEQARIFGIAPPSPEAFSSIGDRYLKHQKARVTAAGYERTRFVVEGIVKNFFGVSKSATSGGETFRGL
jgi:hypothetical protein